MDYNWRIPLARGTGYACLSASLADTCLEQGDLASAKSVLDTGAPVETPMQTMGQRLAWVARGELALAEGNPSAALDIAERLANGGAADGQEATDADGGYAPREVAACA